MIKGSPVCSVFSLPAFSPLCTRFDTLTGALHVDFFFFFLGFPVGVMFSLGCFADLKTIKGHIYDSDSTHRKIYLFCT